MHELPKRTHSTWNHFRERIDLSSIRKPSFQMLIMEANHFRNLWFEMSELPSYPSVRSSNQVLSERRRVEVGVADASGINRCLQGRQYTVSRMY
jgi:hypothetical protein